MNRKELHKDEELLRKIDLLVDDELGGIDRKLLIDRLDATPDGWRLCALAYMEAQILRNSMVQLAGHAGKPKTKTRPKRLLPRNTRPNWAFPVLRWAASFLAVFAIGAAAGAAGERVLALRTPAAKERSAPRIDHDQALAKAEPAPLLRQSGTVTLSESAENVLSGKAPLLSGPGVNEDWLNTGRVGIPDSVQAYWEQRGYELQENRQVVSVDLDDGSRLAIPINQVNFQFVGRTVH